VAPPEAKDVGVRPALESLGPFLWKPSPAPEFILPGPGGALFSPSQYRGHPLLLMFYLGHECKHCIEQLNAFAPVNERFSQLGVTIVAIGIDPPESVGKTLLKAKSARLSISDSRRSEQDRIQGLPRIRRLRKHAAARHVLLDKNGVIVWQDIGYEPFTNVDFLLGEAKRLLANKAESVDARKKSRDLTGEILFVDQFG